VLEVVRPPFAGPRMVAVTLLVMTAAFGLNFAAGVFFAPLSARYGWSVGALSTAAALSTLVGAALTPAVGALLDRIGPRRVLTASLGVLAASYLLLAAVDQLWQFLLVYPLLGGTGFAGSATLANSVLVARWYRRSRATMLARTTLGITLGQVLLLPLAGLLVGQVGTSTAYLVLGAVVLLVAVPAAGLLLRDDPAELGQHPDGTPDQPPGTAVAAVAPAVLARVRRWGVAAFGLHAFTLYAVVLHLPHFAGDLGGDVGIGAAALALAAAVSGATMLVTGPLADRVGHRPVLVVLHAVRVLALLAAAASTGPAQLYGVAVLFGLSSFPIIPVTTALLGAGRDPAGLGRLLGHAWLVHQLAAGAGVLVAGLVRSAAGDYRPWFLLAAATAALGLMSVIRLPDLRRTP
jgi:MFS family permease